GAELHRRPQRFCAAVWLLMGVGSEEGQAGEVCAAWWDGDLLYAAGRVEHHAGGAAERHLAAAVRGGVAAILSLDPAHVRTGPAEHSVDLQDQPIVPLGVW